MMRASVVIPSYQSSRTIRACLASVCGQDLREPFEVILSDSGSDGTAEIAAREFPQVRVLHSATRLSAEEARNRAAEQRKTENRQVLKVFLQWVADNRAAPDKASASPACDPPADAAKEKAKERLCMGSRFAGQYQLSTRYWEAEPAIARFSVKLPDVTTCEEIGASTVLKTWQVATTNGATTTRYRCEFPSGPLAGMNAVLSQAVNADLYVFNPSYLEKEPALRVILDGG